MLRAKQITLVWTMALSFLAMECFLSDSSVAAFAKTKQGSSNPSAEKSLALLLKLRAADDRYSVRSFLDAHKELQDNPRALTEFALNYASMGWNADAMQLIGRALKLSQNDDYVLSSYAWILYKNNNASAALRSATQSVNLKASARNLAILSEVWQALDKADRADEVLSQALKADPDSLDVIAAQVRLSKWRMKCDRAVSFVSNYLVRHPKDLRALILRSEVFEILGRNKDAIADLTSVINQKPDHLYAYQKRAEKNQKEKNFRAAVHDEQKLMTFKLDPSAFVIANITMAECLESLGDLRGALDARRQVYLCETKINNFDLLRGDAKNLNRGFAKDSIEYCRLEIAMKQYDPALKKLNSILQKFPNSTPARELRAHALEGLSRWSEALSDWDRLVSKQSSFPQWYECRAVVYQKLGRKEDARRDIEMARKLSEDF